MKILTAAVMGLALAGRAGAEIRTAEVDYFDGEVKLEGYLAYDPALKGKRPGVVVFHEWTGLGPYEKSRADQLAKLGYVALAGDIYGKGVRPSTQAAAAAEAGKYRGDRALLRRRAGAALAELKQAAQLIPNQAVLINTLPLLESRASSEIENIVTTESERINSAAAGGIKSRAASASIESHHTSIKNSLKNSTLKSS